MSAASIAGRTTIEKTLIFRLSSIGDVVLTTPFLRILRRACPGARIDFAIRKEYADLLRYHPAVTRLHEIDISEGREGLLRWKTGFAAEGYDRIFDLHNNFRTKLMRAGLKIPVVIGGAPVTRDYADQIKAQGYAPDAASAVEEVGRLLAR